MSKKKTHEEFLEDVKSVFGDEVEVIGKYTGNKNKILVKYKKCGHIDMKAPIKLLAGQGCGKCKGKSISKSKTKNTDEYKKDLISNGITYIEVLGEYTGVKNKIFVRNKKCNHKYFANANNILHGSGCPICHGIKDTKLFAEEIEKRYPGEYKIIGEYVNNRTPIRVVHKCGYEWEVIPKDLMRDIRCPNCITSKGELFIIQYLKTHQIQFEREYWFDDCRDKNPLPFDFMIIINGEKRLIEFDGVQHFRDKKSIYSSECVIRHDKIKNEYCEIKGIKLLRIPYWWLRTDKILHELDKFCSE